LSRGVHIDPRITFGHLLTIVTIIAAVVVSYAAYRVEISELTSRIGMLENVAKVQENLNIALHGVRTDITLMREKLERIERERQAIEDEERRWRREQRLRMEEQRPQKQ
jgi:uncharacterized protein (DUF3084 family)